MDRTTLHSLRLHLCRLPLLPSTCHGHGKPLQAFALRPAVQRCEHGVLDIHLSAESLCCASSTRLLHSPALDDASLLHSPHPYGSAGHQLHAFCRDFLRPYMLGLLMADCGWLCLRYLRGDPLLDSLQYLIRNPSRWSPPFGNGELVLNLRGFGVVEQLVFGLSAWLAGMVHGAGGRDRSTESGAGPTQGHRPVTRLPPRARERCGVHCMRRVPCEPLI